MTDLATTKPLEGFQQLDVYAGGVKQEEARVDALATVSAGKKVQKDGKWIPQVSRDGSIILHDPEGRAPGLARMLKASPKLLTITFAHDNPQSIIQQRFVRYSASKLELHGDQFGLTEITDREHVYHEAGSEAYKELLESCKTSASVYFMLAEWDEDGRPRVIMPDGLGYYRLRFTSRNSLSNLMAQLRMVYDFTGGRLAGVPFDLRLVNREVADPKGGRRTVPVWTITMRRPGEMSMSSENFRQVLTSGLHAGRQLKLPPPRPESLEVAMLEPDVDLDTVELDDQQRKQLESGIDPVQQKRRWFGAVKGTHLEDEDARASFLEAHTGMSSLADVVKYLKPEEFDELLIDAGGEITARVEAERTERLEAEAADPDQYPDGVTPEHLEFLSRQLKRAGVKPEQRLDFISYVIAGNSEEVRRNADLTLERLDAFFDKLGSRGTGKFRPISERQLADLVMNFEAWAQSDEAAGEVLG